MNNEIQTMIDHSIQQLPVPEQVTLIHVYNDNQHGDLQTLDGDIIKYALIIGGRGIGNLGVLLYLNNDYHKPLGVIDFAMT